MSYNNNAATVGQHYNPASALNRVYNEAPYYPRCSDNKTAALSRPRDMAINYPYMQVNRKDMVSWLVFDLDHTNCLIWDERGLPPPNLVVSNRVSGKSHLFYAIVPVCTSEKAHSKPIQYMRAVYGAFAAKLHADPAYSGPVAKTPGHPWWKTWEIHNEEYDLGELSEYVDLPRPSRSKKEIDLDTGSRHCLLFEEVRQYAYSIVNREREQSTYERFYQLVLAYAEEKNTFRKRGFTTNLSFAQVKATAKSVSRWTWDRYTGSGRANRGVMKLSGSMALPEKQKLSAKRTHDVRRSKSESAIRVAYQHFVKRGLKTTQQAIAQRAGVSRQTVAKYLTGVIESLKQQESITNNTTNVKFAVHQIPSPSLPVEHISEGIKESDSGLLLGEKIKPPT